jgi:elongation factor Ts
VSEISASAVKALREQTGAGMMDCKKALADAAGDTARAIELLRERGLAKAVKRAGRETTEGTIAIAAAGAAAGIVELGCETDFVAKTDEFQKLASDLAAAAVADGAAATPEALLGRSVGGEKLGERVAAAIAKIGENIVLKRAARVAAAKGRAGGYVHAGGKLGVVVALATEGGGPALDALAKDLAMHVAAADPSPVAIDRDGVPKELLDKEREIFRKQALAEGKPEKIVEKIVEGRVKKFYTEVCLLEQSFVKDADKTVAQLLAEAGQQLGATVSVAGFLRFRLGETSGA